ncbi:MAG: hypothetical protein LBR59_01945 [Endomicrobium sp.]|jgi:predicted small lipoprotein YifL|nr:hypothetical protein [Endomicrobium sp.]
MKKFVLFVVLTFAFALAACGNKKAKEAPATEAIEEEVVDGVARDTMTSNTATEVSEKSK